MKNSRRDALKGLLALPFVGLFGIKAEPKPEIKLRTSNQISGALPDYRYSTASTMCWTTTFNFNGRTGRIYPINYRDE